MADAMKLAYIDAMLWSSTCDESDDCEYLDGKYCHSDLAPETVERIDSDLLVFAAKFDALCEQFDYSDICEEQAGIDFWLTRNGHGAGFWDRTEHPAELMTALTDLAESFGTLDPCIGDDGKLYFL